MNRTFFFSLTVVVFLTMMGSGLFLLNLRNSVPSSALNKEFPGYTVPHLPPLPIQGQSITLETAETLAEFRIRRPSYLGLSADVKLMSIRLISQEGIPNTVVLIYSRVPIDDKAYVDQVVGSGGMILIENPDTRNSTATIYSMVEETDGALKIINVNGSLGVGIGVGVINDQQVHGQIQWWSSGIHYDLIADLSVEELIKVGQSM